MQVTETLNEGLKRGYKIVVTALELDEKVNAKLAEAQPEIEMKGFRKGKVPMPLLKKQFGPRLLGEAMQEAIDAALKQHFEETGNRPAGQPDVKVTNEDWKEGDDIEVSVDYEMLPEIPDVDFKDIKLERLVAPVADDEIARALENLAAEARNFEDRPEGAAAEEGDQVVIDFVGRVDGEAFEGGAAEDFPLVLGSGQFIPGFEEQLIGAKAGDTIEVKVTFPEDYGAEHLAGKEAVFETTVKAVREPKPAPVDDALAQQYGMENLDKLRETVREKMQEEYAAASRQVLKRALMDALDERVSFDLPPSLVESEAKQIAHQLWHEENPDHQGHDHPDIEPTDEHRKLAERRVKLGLFLSELGQKNGIQVTEAEMNRAVAEQARRYPGQEQQFIDFVKNNQEVLQQISAPLFEDKVVDYILELVEVTDREVTQKELQEAIDALSDD